jgi:hypothetical protein
MAASILAQDPSLTPAQVRDAIVNNAKKITPSSGSVWYLATDCSSGTSVPTGVPTLKPTTASPTGGPTSSPSESMFPTSSSKPTSCVCECSTAN